MFPSTPPEGGREPWPDGPRPGRPGAVRGGASAPIAASGRTGPTGATYGAAPAARPPGYPAGGPADDRDGPTGDRARRGGPDPAGRGAPPLPDDDEGEPEEAETVPVRRSLSAAIAGFAGLLAVGLILGAQTSGPDARVPYAIVIFGVQLLFVLSWTMAMRPPALAAVAGVAVLVAAGADAAAALSETATLGPLGYVAAGGFLLSVLAQLLRSGDRARVTDSLGSTLLIVIGVVAFASLIVLTRKPIGTQAVLVGLTATGVSLVVARLTDCFLPRPRMAPQVPRGAAGVVLGAMLGTLAAAVLGGYVAGFTPTSAAIVGVVAATAAGLADLAANYAEAGRQMAGEAPTFWIARHMQGPLGGFALAAPVGYAMAVLYLT